MSIIGHPSTVIRIPFVLRNQSTDLPVTGLTTGDIQGNEPFLVKPTGATQSIPLGSLPSVAQFTEVDGTFAPGLYTVALLAVHVNLVGPYTLVLLPQATQFKPSFTPFSIENFVTSTLTDLIGTPAAGSIANDIANVLASAQNTNTLATTIRKIQTNRWKVVSNQLILYDDDKTTPFLIFNLFDDAGAPTMGKIFERVPVGDS